MATLQNRIELIDGVSPALTKMRQTTETLSKRFTSSISTMKSAYGTFRAYARWDLLGYDAEKAMGMVKSAIASVPAVADSMATRVVNALNRISAKGASMGAGGGFLAPLKQSLSGMMGGMVGQFTIAGLLTNGLASAAGFISQLPGQIMAASGEYSSIQARLQLVTGSQEKAVALNRAIYESALRARGSYSQMADSVSKIAMTAKEAFPDASAVAPFVEGIQKLFVIGGTDAAHQGDAMLQLTQALGSGKLQGDEFRSIAEAAPLIEQMVAKQMGVTQGKLKELSSEGKITADIIRDAIMNNMDEINAQFDQMPKKWSDIWNEVGTRSYNAFAPVFEAITELASSPLVNSFVGMVLSGVETAAAVLQNVIFYVKNVWNAISDGAKAAVNAVKSVFGGVFEGIANNVAWFGGIFKSNMGIVEPILVALTGILAVMAVRSAISYGIAAAGAIAHGVATMIETAQILALIIAQEGFNAALAACPLTWIIGLVVLAVVAFYGLIAVINRVAGTSISATGLIFGAFAFLFTHIINGFKTVANVVIAVANFFGSVFNSPLDAAYNLFVDIWNAIVDYVTQAVNSIIDVVNQIPGLDKAFGKFDNVNAPTIERKTIADAAFHIDPFELGSSSYNAMQAYKMGERISNFEIPKPPELSDITDGDSTDKSEDDAKDSKSGRQTAGNTGKMVDALDDLEDDMKDWRAIAEQEAINYYTNKDYKISVGDINNSINKPADVDGVISSITRYLREGMSAGAEAVHA